MDKKLIYAKKLRFPPHKANGIQTLNMALAFEENGIDVHFYPGMAPSGHVRSRSQARAELTGPLQAMGQDALPRLWRPLFAPTKGIYGAKFRCALLMDFFIHKHALFYARDVGEANLLALACRCAPRHCLYEAHEVLHTMHRSQGRARWKATRKKELRILAAMAGVVATSAGVAEELRDALGYAGPLLIASNGFNPNVFHPLPLFDDTHPWPGPEDPVRLVYVGSLHEGKGVDVLLETLSCLPSRFTLKIIGGYPHSMFAALHKKIKKTHGLAERVVLAGGVEPKKIRDLCADSHIFVIPQQSAYFFSPLKLYEAFALGLPVVTTPLQPFAEHARAQRLSMAGDASPQGLCAAVQALAQQPHTAFRLRANGLEDAREHTWKKRAEKIWEFASSLKKK